MRTRPFVLAATLIALAATSHAQVFKATTELVTVPLSVSGRRADRPVGDLTVNDFRVTEDGVEQTISLLDQQRRPLSLCIVLDSSTSMRAPRQDLARLAIDATLKALSPDDEFAVVVFAGGVRVAVPWTPANQPSAIAWSTYQLSDGGTVLNDALKQALDVIEEAHNERVAVLVVSDGQENQSTIPLSRVVSTRRQSETLVYAFRTDAPLPQTPVTRGDRPLLGTPRNSGEPPPGVALANELPPDVLPSLVGDSGGVVYPVTAAAGAEAAAKAFIDELRTLYTLGYTPKKAPDGKYRRVKVEPRSRDLRVRHRGGYLARTP